MKKTYNPIFYAILAASALVASLALAQDKTETPAKPELKPEEVMKKMAAAGAPGAAHKALEALVGEWTAEVKCWMDPKGEPMLSKATAKASWMLDGRFVREEFKGEMMGKPFIGVSLTGYDNMKQKYTSVWVDDMSTGILTSMGTMEGDGKVLTLTGKMDCAMTDEKDVTIKQVLRILSADKHVFEMHDPRLGEKSKTMEITYTRSN